MPGVRRYGLSLVSERLEPTGIGIYGISLARAIAPLLEKNERLVVFRHERFPGPGPVPGLEEVTLRFPAGTTASRRIAEQTLLPAAALLARVHVLHAINFVAPVLWRGPLVVTLHDARLFAARAHAGIARRLYRDALYGASVRRATRLLADSDFAARSCSAVFGLEGRSITTVYLGVDHAAIGRVGETDRRRVAARLGLRGPALLFAGELEPHKNVTRLVEAFASVAGARPDVSLVLAGGRGPELGSVRARVEALGLRDRVVFPGYLPRADLLALLSLARGLVFPSLEEGFGLPVIEAMAAGTPVACSRRGALDEIVGDAVLPVDPLDVSSIARAIDLLLGDDALHADLAERGRRQAARFTWARAARATLDSYRAVGCARAPRGRVQPGGAPARAPDEASAATILSAARPPP